MQSNNPTPKTLQAWLLPLLVVILGALIWAGLIRPRLQTLAGVRERTTLVKQVLGAAAPVIQQAGTNRPAMAVLSPAETERFALQLCTALSQKHGVALKEASRTQRGQRAIPLPASQYDAVSFALKLSGPYAKLRALIQELEASTPLAICERASFSSDTGKGGDLRENCLLDLRLAFVEKLEGAKK